MLVVNNTKTIRNTGIGADIGTLYHYVIDKDDGTIKYIIFTNDDYLFYANEDEIVQINDTHILVNGSTKGSPSDVSKYTRIDMPAVTVDIHGDEHGIADYYSISEGKLTGFVSDNKLFHTNELMDASYYYNVFESEGESIGPTPGPTPPSENKEKSFKYASLLGRKATRSIYSCRNTPIIIEGESVTPENIISAILECKLIELIKNTK